MGCKGSRVQISALRPIKTSTCVTRRKGCAPSGYHQGYQSPRRASRKTPCFALAVAIAASLAGCASLPGIPDSGRTEFAFQALNAVDYAQTINIARRPDCYHETDSVTSRLIGAHPSSGAVAGMWAAQATAHYYVTRWLDREVDSTDATGWRITRWIWLGATFWMAGHHVVQNHSIGLRPFSGGAAPNQCAPARLESSGPRPPVRPPI